MKITIPKIPPSDNIYKGRQNVWQYRKDKETWLEYMRGFIKPPSEPYEKAVVNITYYFKTKIRHDPDNYSGKFLLDGLVKWGVIQDDSFDHIHLELNGNYDKANPRTEIEITEAI